MRLHTRLLFAWTHGNLAKKAGNQANKSNVFGLLCNLNVLFKSNDMDQIIREVRLCFDNTGFERRTTLAAVRD